MRKSSSVPTTSRENTVSSHSRDIDANETLTSTHHEVVLTDSVEKELLLSELGYRQLAAGCTDKAQRSSAPVVQPYSYKISRVVALIVLLLLFSFVGPCYVSASSHASCDQHQFCPHLCQPWQYYRQAITGTDKCSWKADIDEEPVEASQPQTESEISSSTLTKSAMTSCTNRPPVEEYDANPPLKDLDIDSLARYYFTESNMEDISNFQRNTSGRDYVWIMLGVTGAGKSCLGNFILQQDNNIFPEAVVPLMSMTQKASIGCTVFDSQRLCVVDTPGFRDTLRIGTHVSKAMDIANDASHVVIELTRMMMLTNGGIDTFFIVVPLHHSDFAGLRRVLNIFDIILDNYWSYSILVLTHGAAIGGTKDEQYKTFKDLLKDPDCPPILIDLVKKVNHRFVIVEAKDWRSDTAYRNGVVTKLLSLSNDIFEQHGRYQDSLQSIGREAHKKAKLEFQNEFEDIDSPEAKATIFQSTFSYVREAILKLVRIKLADGDDVDKLKEMNELKDKMLEEIRKQIDQLHQEFLEEQRRRRQAEDEQKRIEEERRKEEQRRKQGEVEETLKTSQSQTESETLSTPTPTKSGIPSSSNAPPDEGNDKGTSKIPFENLDYLTQYNPTEKDLSILQGHTVEEGDYMWMELGVTGAGKSCLGNFILQEDSRFPESEIIQKSKTQKASMECTVFNTQRLCVVDTPGLGDTLRIGTHKSKAMDIANDASHLIIELTKMMMLTKTGISAFFIVVPLHHRDYAGLQQLLDFFDILGNYWNHSIVVLTHGTAIGGTKDEQYKTFTDLLQDPDCPPILIDLVKKVNDRFVIVEAKDWRSDTAYRDGVVAKLLSLSDDIIERHGHYQDHLQSIGREAYQRAKLQYRNEFEDINSPEAKAAIFQSTFSYVREAVLKLVRIKLADGEDVDKLKEMNELKEKMLEEIRKQRDQLHQEFLEEQKRRKEAEEEQKRIEEERRKEEQRRKEAEEEQRKAEERRREAEEQKLKEQREKEEAQKKLEEYLKKPTFNERRITVDVYRSNFYRWEWVHSAEAVDVATGISAKAQNYASKSGAEENARENLKAILLDRGIIRKDDI